MSDKQRSDGSGPQRKRGKRYTAEQKAKVVKFVKDYNAKHGRGGQSRAVAKFGISQLTVASWLRSGIIDSAGSKHPAAKGRSGEDSLAKKVKALIEVSDQLRKHDREGLRLRARYESLRSSILRDL